MAVDGFCTSHCYNYLYNRDTAMKGLKSLDACMGVYWVNLPVECTHTHVRPEAKRLHPSDMQKEKKRWNHDRRQCRVPDKGERKRTLYER
jgi:hypothetical protein